MHEYTRQKDARQAQSTLDQRPTPGTRGADAGYLLHVRRLRSSEHLAHTWRASNACPVLHEQAIHSAR